MLIIKTCSSDVLCWAVYLLGMMKNIHEYPIFSTTKVKHVNHQLYYQSYKFQCQADAQGCLSSMWYYQPLASNASSQVAQYHPPHQPGAQIFILLHLVDASKRFTSNLTFLNWVQKLEPYRKKLLWGTSIFNDAIITITIFICTI